MVSVSAGHKWWPTFGTPQGCRIQDHPRCGTPLLRIQPRVHHTCCTPRVTLIRPLNWANTRIDRYLPAGTPRELVGLADLSFSVGDDLPSGPGGQRAERGLPALRAARGRDGLGAAGRVAGCPAQRSPLSWGRRSVFSQFGRFFSSGLASPLRGSGARCTSPAWRWSARGVTFHDSWHQDRR
jgi:hypothetical protein